MKNGKIIFLSVALLALSIFIGPNLTIKFKSANNSLLRSDTTVAVYLRIIDQDIDNALSDQDDIHKWQKEDESGNYHGGMAIFQAIAERHDLEIDIASKLKKINAFPADSIRNCPIMSNHYKKVLDEAKIIADLQAHPEKYQQYSKVGNNQDSSGCPQQGASPSSQQKALPPLPGTGGPGTNGNIR